MTNKSFHLKWNNHLQNLQTLFENLYNEQSLVDVTISCSDGILYGHKLVLSACSPYFEQVFKDNPCKHPILILKGISRHDMQVLLEYMYVGSVDVGEDDLEMLLDVATELQIKGLVQNREESSVHTHPKQDKQHNLRESQITVAPQSPATDLKWQAELVARPSVPKPRESDPLSNNHFDISRPVGEITPVNNQSDEQQYHEDNEVSFEPVEEVSRMSGSQGEAGEESSDNVHNYDLKQNMTSDSDDVTYFCHMCNKVLQNKSAYHRHMMTHAGVKPHQCSFCKQSFLRLSHLQRHIRVHTGERPYRCDHCPKEFARSDKLRQHFVIAHNNSDRAKSYKPRGRPKKNYDMSMPSTSTSSLPPPINSLYPVSINPVSMNVV